MRTIFILFFVINHGLAQDRTIGLLTYDPIQSEEGYTLFYPRNQSTVYLIDNCGEVVHSWEDDDSFVPNNSVYLLENGDLIKCKKIKGHGPIGSGQGGFFVEIRSWDNDLKWSYELNSVTERLHHDVEWLPSGNMLMIAWEFRSETQALLNGRLPETMDYPYLYPDYIFEINPNTNEKVWEWHSWDHMIQDVDSSLVNFGVVSDHPELIDINYAENNSAINWDWMHINAVDYNATLDQVMLCVPYFNELWIIDHSTTTEEASGHSGGASGKGGDLLYRVGNPQAYKKGDEEDKILFFPHDTHWTNDFIEPSHPDYNKILIFNNQVDGSYSKMEKFDNPWDAEAQEYPLVDGLFHPVRFEQSTTHPDTFSFFSRGLSSVQVLPNENLLSCDGDHGHFIEFNTNNKIVWEYKVPYKNGDIMPQGTELGNWQNMTFRAFRYPRDYIAFEGKDLSPKGPIEFDSEEDYCERVVPTSEIVLNEISLFPNPVNSLVHIDSNSNEKLQASIYNVLGVKVKSLENIDKSFDISDLEAGVYFVVFDHHAAIPLIKI